MASATPRPAFGARCDLTAYASTAVWSHATQGNRTLGALTAPHLDLPAFVHGYATRDGMDLASLVNAAWSAGGGAGTWTVGLDDYGYVWFENDTVDFTVNAGAENAVFGFDTAGHALVGGVAPFRRTATARYTRGIVELQTGVSITEDAGPTVVVPLVGPRIQSIPTWIRVRGSEADADDLYDGLTLDDTEPTGAGLWSSWVVERDGRVTRWSRDTHALTWQAAGYGLAQRLGYVGRGNSAASAGREYDATVTYNAFSLDWIRYTSALPNRLGFLVAHEALLRDKAESDASELRAYSGYHHYERRSYVRAMTATVRTKGATWGREYDQKDELAQFFKAAPLGVTYYPAWGDDTTTAGAMELRRHRPESRVFGTAVETTLYTADASRVDLFYGAPRGGRQLFLYGGPHDWNEAYIGERVDSLADTVFTLYVDVDLHPEQIDEAP